MNIYEAYDELALRLLYEYVFDIVPIRSFNDKNQWFNPTLRDKGHHKRISLLMSKIRSTNDYTRFNRYKWLTL